MPLRSTQRGVETPVPLASDKTLRSHHGPRGGGLQTRDKVRQGQDKSRRGEFPDEDVVNDPPKRVL